MLVDLNSDELQILRALLICDRQNVKGLPQIMREGIVLKLHAALEQVNEESISEHSSFYRVH
jgi:hypothetical protein